MKIKYIMETENTEKEIKEAFKKVQATGEIMFKGHKFNLPLVLKIGVKDIGLSNLLGYNYAYAEFNKKELLHKKTKTFLKRAFDKHVDIFIIYSCIEDCQYIKNYIKSEEK